LFGLFGSCCEETPDAGDAAVEPSRGQDPQRDAKYVCEQIHHVRAKEVRGAQRLDRAHSPLVRFVEVVHDGEEFAGQLGDVYDNPEQEEGGEEATREVYELIAVDTRESVWLWHDPRYYSLICSCNNAVSSQTMIRDSNAALGHCLPA
jgi:hypothetical protein